MLICAVLTNQFKIYSARGGTFRISVNSEVIYGFLQLMRHNSCPGRAILS